MNTLHCRLRVLLRSRLEAPQRSPQARSFRPFRRARTLFPLGSLALVALLGTGCQATLQHRPFTGAAAPPKGSLGVMSRAQNMPERIGWGTFTVFAIPVAPVTVAGKADEELMKQIAAAAEHCGFQVQMVEGAAGQPEVPVLTCDVRKARFRNYTYFFPLVFNWGTLDMNFALQAPDGRVILYATCRGKGNGAYSFNSTVNKALTKALEELIPVLTGAEASPPFRQFVCPNLRSADSDEVCATLQALRRLNAPDAVPQIQGLLQHKDSDVVRDACLTLAALGNKDVIPALEPLLNDKRSKVRSDARLAIDQLRSKS